MRLEIIKHDYQGKEVGQRSDGYVYLTQLCHAGGKQVGHYLALKSTQELLSALAADLAIAITGEIGSGSLIEIQQGGNEEKGTWGHPEIAIDCAKWVSIPMRIWANRTLLKVIRGEVLDPSQYVTHEQLEARLKTTPALPTANIDPIPQPMAPMTERAAVARSIDNYARNQTNSNPLSHAEIRRWMYRELKYRYRYDVYARVKKSKLTKIDQIESDGQLPNLLAICNHLLKAHA